MTSAAAITQELAQKTRTLVLGGAAVILHGLNRSTKDLDLWVDPNPTPEAWAGPIIAVLQAHLEMCAAYLDDSTGQWEKVDRNQLAHAAANGRVLRLTGCDRPIDIFYEPNEVELANFDEFWNRAQPLRDGTRLLDPIDLIITKQLTNRPHDQADIQFLEVKIETEMGETLPKASYDQALALLERFRSAKVAFSATTNPDTKVRELGIQVLKELAQGGDPFAQEHLDEILRRKI